MNNCEVTEYFKELMTHLISNLIQSELNEVTKYP